jgi:hypothetical protein
LAIFWQTTKKANLYGRDINLAKPEKPPGAARIASSSRCSKPHIYSEGPTGVCSTGGVLRINRLTCSNFDLFAVVQQIADARAQFRWRDLIRTRTAEGRSRTKAQGRAWADLLGQAPRNDRIASRLLATLVPTVFGSWAPVM